MLDNLIADEQILYKAVATRTLLMFAPDYKYESTTVIVEANGLNFKTIGTIPKRMGWKKLKKEEKDKTINDTEKTLPLYNEGQYIPFYIDIESKETKPPKQLSESDLVEKNGLLEKYNLDTPATRPDIIET